MKIDIPTHCPICNGEMVPNHFGDWLCNPEGHCKFYTNNKKDTTAAVVAIYLKNGYSLQWYPEVPRPYCQIRKGGSMMELKIPWIDFPEIIDREYLYNKIKLYITFS